MANILQKLLTMGEGKQLREFEQRVRAHQRRSSPRSRRSPTSELAAKTVEFRDAARERRGPRRPAARGLRGRARGGQARARHASLRRAARRRHGAPRRADRRDEDRRGQDARLHARRLPERAARQGRPRRHRQRLPGQARQRVDGPHLPLPRHGRRHHPGADGPGQPRIPAYAADITYGTNSEFGFDYLRDNMVVEPERPRAARPPLRHRRRGRLDPHRRGADPAHHLRRRARKSADTYKQFAKVVPRLQARRGLRAATRPSDHRRHRDGPAQGRAAPRHRRHLRRPVRPAGQPPAAGAQGAVHVQARRRLRGQGRRGPHRRRVHRPPHGTAAATRRACTRPSRPRSACTSGGEPDARDHHAAELLPPVREALRHDRYGRHRGRRVPRDLQAPGHGRPDQPAHDPRRPRTT